MVNLLEGEKIELIRRRHWFVIVAQAITLFLFALMPFILLMAAGTFSDTLADALSKYIAYIILFGAAWLTFLWMIFFVTWTNYYLDVLLVTNKRIIDIEQIGLFSRDIAEIRLESIQDVKVEVIGFLQSLLKMGNLHIQTAGQHKEVSLPSIPDPYQVKDVISRCYDRVVHKSIPYVGSKN